MSIGTSRRFIIGAEAVREIKKQAILPADAGTDASPPNLPTTGEPSLAFTKWVNPWPEFAFNRISFPKYDNATSVSWYLARPRNEPSFVMDYHYIGMMRLIDVYLAPAYSGTITQTGTGPGPNPPG